MIHALALNVLSKKIRQSEFPVESSKLLVSQGKQEKNIGRRKPRMNTTSKGFIEVSSHFEEMTRCETSRLEAIPSLVSCLPQRMLHDKVKTFEVI